MVGKDVSQVKLTSSINLQPKKVVTAVPLTEKVTTQLWGITRLRLATLCNCNDVIWFWLVTCLRPETCTTLFCSKNCAPVFRHRLAHNSAGHSSSVVIQDSRPQRYLVSMRHYPAMTSCHPNRLSAFGCFLLVPFHDIGIL